MTILLMLIPLGLVILAVAVAVFIWAVRSGQFEDLEGEGERIFYDDAPLPALPGRGEKRSGESANAKSETSASASAGVETKP
jgi:cbb3-type cytochrome oxidase maturation protein